MFRKKTPQNISFWCVDHLGMRSVEAYRTKRNL